MDQPHNPNPMGRLSFFWGGRAGTEQTVATTCSVGGVALVPNRYPERTPICYIGAEVHLRTQICHLRTERTSVISSRGHWGGVWWAGLGGAGRADDHIHGFWG